MLDLIDTDNKVLNKVLIVFSTLCLEVRSLDEELSTQYLERILYYGEGSEYSIQYVHSFIVKLSQDLIQLIYFASGFF